MSTERPTFSENWHRIAELHPRLRFAVQTYRQSFRGRIWHVLADPANDQYFRLSESAYHFVALLDGQRNVTDCWHICNDHLGDDAPTQGEVINLLGQLYTSNLLIADLPPDAEQVFKRYRKRIRREVGSYFMNFLFVRIPLFDPQRLLERWVGVVGWLFSPIGFAMWVILLGMAGWHLVGRWGELWQGADPQVLLNTDNLLIMYLCFAGIKALHELGHGFVCVRCGRKEGVPTYVHTIGIMLLVFAPVPYVDASSSWMLSSKWRRAFVGAAGMYVELAIAAVAAIVWAHTSESNYPAVHAITYNLIFIASVSTLLFNGNPLLRFDGYYILCDLLEIANLQQHARQQLYNLFRKHPFGVRNVRPIAHTKREYAWLIVYAITSFAYRVLICIGILMYVAGVFFFLGVLMAISAIVMWVFVPIGKFIRYLLTNPELERTRNRAIGITVGVVVPFFVFLGFIPVSEHDRAEGIVEPVRIEMILMGTDGFITTSLPSGTEVEPGGQSILTAENRKLQTERQKLIAHISATRIRLEMARTKNTAAMLAITDQIAALNQRLQYIEDELATLTVHATFKGIWVSDVADRIEGVFFKRGRQIGLVADPSDLIIRVTADQSLGPRIEEEIGTGDKAIVELRVKGRPNMHLKGTICKVLPAGQQELPSAALGYVAGGSVAVAMNDQSGRKTTEPFFEVHVKPELSNLTNTKLLIGQRVVVRFELPPRPLLIQWWHSIQQVIQQRFSLPT